MATHWARGGLRKPFGNTIVVECVLALWQLHEHGFGTSLERRAVAQLYERIKPSQVLIIVSYIVFAAGQA